MDNIVDCKGRAMDDIYLYYGERGISNIDKSELINHSFKARVDGKLPKCGFYCMPEDLFNEIGIEYASKLNKMFRNVQYIVVGGTLYWVYCFDINGIYGFSFIGTNISMAVASKVLTSNGYELGFKRQFSADGTELSKIVEVWFHPQLLVMIVLKKPVYDFIISDKISYYRKFESDEIICDTKYSAILPDIIIRIPLTNSYQDDDIFLKWSSIIDVSVDEDKTDLILIWDDYEANHLLFDRNVYERMMEIMFNYVRCKFRTNGVVIPLPAA